MGAIEALSFEISSENVPFGLKSAQKLSVCSRACFVLPFCPVVVILYYCPRSETNSFFISIKAETTGFRLHFYFGGRIWLKSQLP